MTDVSGMYLTCVLVLFGGVAEIKGQGSLIMPPGISLPVSPKDPCVEIRSKSGDEIMSLPRHKFMVLEHCLYYDLQRQVDTLMQQPNGIALLPPSDGHKQGNVSIMIHTMTLQHIWLNDMMKDMHLRGFFQISWIDPRLKWDEQKWKTNELRVQTSSHIWVPQMSSSKVDSSVANGDFADLKNIRIRNGGNVTAFVNFNLQAFCDVDLENFPADKHDCCFHMQPSLYRDLVVFKSASSPVPVQLDTKFYRETGWAVSGVALETTWGEEGSTDLGWCVQLTRASTTIRIELSIPMVICAILILISPLFGSFQQQLHVKLFGLLLQYLCLQFLANKMSHLGMGRKTPRIFEFYEFTIVINVVSILITVFVWLLARMQRTLPPSNSMSKLASIINKFFCCLTCPEDMSCLQEAHASKNYREDWSALFHAIHGMLMAGILLIYVTGIAVIYG